MKVGAVLLVAACCAVFAPSVSAEVRVTFADGRVTIVATDATISEILAEWQRVGGSTFIDADKIPAGERLTIRLEDEREIDALEVLLRRVAGYMVAPADRDPASASTISRVFILPTSTPAPYTPPPPAPVVASESSSPFNMSAAPPQPDDDGPVLVTTQQPAPAQTEGAGPSTAAPLGQASPLTNATPTQTVPGLGIVTSSQPGVTIEAQQPRSRRPIATPTRPRPGGGGGR